MAHHSLEDPPPEQVDPTSQPPESEPAEPAGDPSEPQPSRPDPGERETYGLPGEGDVER